MLRAVGALAAELKRTGVDDAHTLATLDALRRVANSLDRLEHDPDRSEHTVGANARVFAQLLEQVRPADTSGVDDLDAFRTAIADAARTVRDTPAN